MCMQEFGFVVLKVEKKMHILEQIAKTDKDLQKLLEEYKNIGDF